MCGVVRCLCLWKGVCEGSLASYAVTYFETTHHVSCWVYTLSYSVSRPGGKQRQVTRCEAECTADLSQGVQGDRHDSDE